MGKIVVSEFVSLDGVVENPIWSAPYWNDEIAKFKGDENSDINALLLGRETYEAFAKAWPQSTDIGAEYMNSLPKYVASRTLDTAEWNATIIKGDIVEEISKLKQSNDLLVYGSVDFIDTLIEHNLVDQFNLLIYPVVLGSGKRLFQDGRKATLQLVETKAFSSGVVAMIYRPAPPEAQQS